jgi:hypothetical protein
MRNWPITDFIAARILIHFEFWHAADSPITYDPAREQIY